VAGGHRRKFTAAGIAGAIACLGAIFAAPVSAETGGTGTGTIIQDPNWIAPLPVGASRAGIRSGGPAVGHWFSYGYTNNCGARKTVTEVKLVERPVTKARPFKAAILYVTAEYEGERHEVREGVIYGTPCTADMRFATGKVQTKRPAKKLIIYDGSSEPPQRIWPPVGTPPEK